jgi:hypothetical protein
MRINERETEITIDALTLAANLAGHPAAVKEITRLKNKLSKDLANFKLCKEKEEARLDDEQIKIQGGLNV